MLPSSNITASDCWNALKNGNRTHVRMVFSNQDIWLEDEDIDINTGVVITDILNGDTDLVFGKAVMKQMRTRVFINDKTRYLRWNDKFYLSFGIEVNGSTKWTVVGYFTGERPNNVTTESVVDFIAYDDMQKFEVLADGFSSTLTFPCTLSTIIRRLCHFIGLTHGSVESCVLPSSTDVPILDRVYDKLPIDETGHTCRELLAMIAEACGLYARIRQGYLYLEWFEDHTSTITISEDEQFSMEHADLYYGLTWNEFDEYSLDEQEAMTWDEVSGHYSYTYGISCVRIRQSNLGFDVDYPQSTTPETRNVYMIVDNPFLQIRDVTSDRNTYVKNLYDRLHAFGGRLPMNFECIGNYQIESGDIITVVTGGETIQMPIYCKTLVWKGSITDTLETTGNKDRAPITSSNANKVMNTESVRLFVEDRYYKQASGVAIDADGVTISGSKTIDIESGSSIDIESGGEVNIKSGGEININSGGNLNLNSGGQLDIQGSTVQIGSGSTFDLDSTNLKITSNDGEIEVVDGGLKVKTVIDATRDYNFYLGGIIGNYYDQEKIKAALAGTVFNWINGNQTITSYPIQLVIQDEITTPGTKHQTIVYFGRTTFTKEIYTGSSSVKELRTGIKVAALNATTNSVIDSVIESSVGIFKNVEVDRVEAYTVRTVQLLYRSTAQSSSREIKHNIQPLLPVGEKLDRLQPVTYVYDDDKDEKTRMGLVYEDTVEVMPEICTNDETNKGISYIELIPALLREIQDLRARVKALEERGIN